MSYKIYSTTCVNLATVLFSTKNALGIELLQFIVGPANWSCPVTSSATMPLELVPAVDRPRLWYKIHSIMYWWLIYASCSMKNALNLEPLHIIWWDQGVWQQNCWLQRFWGVSQVISSLLPDTIFTFPFIYSQHVQCFSHKELFWWSLADFGVKSQMPLCCSIIDCDVSAATWRCRWASPFIQNLLYIIWFIEKWASFDEKNSPTRVAVLYLRLIMEFCPSIVDCDKSRERQ
jgi:hypothetical protein